MSTRFAFLVAKLAYESILILLAEVGLFLWLRFDYVSLGLLFWCQFKIYSSWSRNAPLLLGCERPSCWCEFVRTFKFLDDVRLDGLMTLLYLHIP